MKNSQCVNAPIYFRDFLIEQQSFLRTISQCDILKQWTIPENLVSGIWGYIRGPPTEFKWKLKLKQKKYRDKFGEDMPSELDQREMNEIVSSDDEWDSGAPWTAPEMIEGERCICICRCEGAPVIEAPSIPVMQRALSYKNGKAIVHFKPPLNDGNAPITGYQVMSVPDGITKSGARSPIKIGGLTVGVWYQFVVRARNRRGIGPPSVPSNMLRIR